MVSILPAIANFVTHPNTGTMTSNQLASTSARLEPGSRGLELSATRSGQDQSSRFENIRALELCPFRRNY